MADYVETKIYQGLVAQLKSLGLSEPIKHANVDSEPPSSGGYLQVNHLPATTQRRGIEPGASNWHTGLFQVSVFWPAGQGLVKPMEVAGEIIAGFKHGTSITREGQVIRIDEPPYINPAVQEGDWVSIPVRVPYWASAPNPV